VHTRPFTVAIATAALAATWQLSGVAGAARCSYEARYPSAFGRQAFMLATATATAVTAPVDTQYLYGNRDVPAQVMRVADVAGYGAEEIRRGLRASGGTAVFIRYRISMACTPFPALDGAFDSAGVNGLYVGRPRPADRWIDGRPTFDIVMAPHFPLPQNLGAPSGHVVMVRRDTTPTMTAAELFTMYRALWADTVVDGDQSVERRIRRWIAASPQAARKQPATQVATDMVMAVANARVAAHAIPFGGTFVISVIVRGLDSLTLYGQTSPRTRLWITTLVRDSLTAVPVASASSSFAVDVTTAASLEGFARSSIRINPCSPIPIVVDRLPIVPDADSTWRGEMFPTGFLGCAPPGSALAKLSLPRAVHPFVPGPSVVTFRWHRDGRVTFESQAVGDGPPWIVVRGERVSTTSYGESFD
jgi:hypothetical protein